ncbi:CGNR zinc finger domain-containing protein [Streptomyces actinomycinicus]|uniref:CGNR zinc finger domain-containing protein n=1 Tax=Streptomyces actinomycinicus TaxID=1695166 RepID=A0A937JSV7_9ACTN|nr:CGNR zinc finger domain-containing protein [Streptomyces actinomycinicus]MBL1087147.1 CGNR zinc finger domain-containing protein [Streptomyces actinomycinicus]
MALGTATSPYELRFDAGRICLDLLATTHPAERLDAVGPLCAWIAGAALVPPGTPLAHADASWLVGFRELRGHVGQLLRTSHPVDAGAYECALARVNETARTAPPAPRAVRGADGTLVRELAEPPGCAALLALVALDAVELLTDPVAWAAVRECEGDDCPLVYLDTSRGRRRRWCSSEVCGNRERVARHRRRAALARA